MCFFSVMLDIVQQPTVSILAQDSLAEKQVPFKYIYLLFTIDQGILHFCNCSWQLVKKPNEDANEAHRVRMIELQLSSVHKKISKFKIYCPIEP